MVVLPSGIYILSYLYQIAILAESRRNAKASRDYPNTPASLLTLRLFQQRVGLGLPVDDLRFFLDVTRCAS
jgi:hypothetical protein